MYSGFSEELKVDYSLNLFFFYMITFGSCIYKWVSFDYESRKFDAFQDQTFKIGCQVFNCWDWRINNQQMKDNLLKGSYS
mmetsp:Transcript_5649/g.8935  ORF Transcript_5649/g.8935 Transcript_5649/m.8935 type:complete len:80 (+) Transcript_5649:931-1170(+)